MAFLRRCKNHRSNTTWFQDRGMATSIIYHTGVAPNHRQPVLHLNQLYLDLVSNLRHMLYLRGGPHLLAAQKSFYHTEKQSWYNQAQLLFAKLHKCKTLGGHNWLIDGKLIAGQLSERPHRLRHATIGGKEICCRIVTRSSHKFNRLNRCFLQARDCVCLIWPLYAKWFRYLATALIRFYIFFKDCIITRH